MIPEKSLYDEMRGIFEDGLLRLWYPLVLDTEYGGYFTNLTYDWHLAPQQEKMIVTQARHVCTTSKVADFVDDGSRYEGYARHGYAFLRDVMWDHEHGGFFQIRSREGGSTKAGGWREEKRTYGNAFGIYALAAFAKKTGDHEALAFARKAFHWLEEHAFDPKHKGYFQFLTREGRPFGPGDTYTTVACDALELGYKDQNSSIHLLEAYTELLRVWDDVLLRERLAPLLELIRDTMVTPRGYLQLFFYPDWTPVSFRDASDEVRRANYQLDHVSFGHDYETAFLMLEASHALELSDGLQTLTVAKRMLDHALENGWDEVRGGFYDGGYYLEGSDKCTIVKDTKNWWAQAEALNTLLLFSRIFPGTTAYAEYFQRQWNYIKTYVLDPENGDWFEGGLDKEPCLRTGPKSHIWKCTYHTSRSLMNCIALLAGPAALEQHPPLLRRAAELKTFVNYWREVGKAIAVEV